MYSFYLKEFYLIVPWLILLNTYQGFTQEAIVKGKVKDALTQKELAGVSVLVKGSLAGTSRAGSHINKAAGFVQVDFDISRKFKLIGGVRADKLFDFNLHRSYAKFKINSL